MLADPNLTAWIAARDDGYIVNYYNQPTSTKIYIPFLIPTDLAPAVVGTELLALSQAKSQAMLVLLAFGNMDATLPSIRGIFSAIWAGTTTLTNLGNISQRFATVFELLFTTASVSAVFGELVTLDDVSNFLNTR
jgi:hypothetical protein